MSRSAEEVLLELYAVPDGIESNESKVLKILLAFRDEAVHEEFVRMSDHCNAAMNEAYEKAAKVLTSSPCECEITLDQDGLEHIICENEKKIRALKTAPAKELLFSGQCNHHIPIGQPCSACGR